MKLEPSALTSFALNELENSAEAEHFKSDPAARLEIAEIRKLALLIEKALAEEPMPASRTPSKRNMWLVGAATAAAAALMIFALPHVVHKNGQESVSVVEDAFAESFSPGLNKDAIRQVVRSHLGEVRKCYEDQLKMNPSLSGKLLLRFALSDAGVVSEASVKKSTIPSEAVSSCILDRVKKWTFPAGVKGTVGVVEYPFEFSSK
jgi:hypothetical protein